MCRILFFLVAVCHFSFGQNKVNFQLDAYEISQFSYWSIEAAEYQGTFYFGFSEAEWSMHLVAADGVISAQTVRREWVLDAQGNAVGMKNVVETYNDLSIRDGAVYTSSDRLLLRFAILDNAEKAFNLRDYPDQIVGVMFYNSNSIEFGEQGDAEKMDGAYPNTYWRLLDQKELLPLTKKQLQIMRNEIFARYGYIFKKGGAMDLYFRKESWYRPAIEDATPYLTSIEKANIELIQSAERKLK